ncbi:MAG: beta-ketoacyl-ACP reductase [Thermoplasmata archaeon]|nr:beta-ketoacyl-ACP reductase [Thermoplasmata archaeon]
MSQTAIITGANGGIGSAIAATLAKNGYNVVLHYHKRNENVIELQNILPTERSMAMSADVNDFDAVEKVVKAATDKFGTIDVLVNNVGIAMDSTLLKMSKQQWDNVIGTNLTGMYNFTKPVAQCMVENGTGVIVNISSVVGEGGNFGQTNYSASKADVIGFTKSLAKELAAKGVRVNAVAPGFVDTEMTRKIPDGIRAKITEQIPMKRFGTPDEIADTVLFLCRATYVTGSVIDVNGGLR